MLPPRYQYTQNPALNGGYGTVIPVKDTYLDRTVLFKAMQDPKNNQQLINEVQNLSKARSRHVVEIYDTILDDSGNIVGIIIEYLTGREYLDFHVEASRNTEEFVRIIYQISTAIADLHQSNIVHRDIKLENIKSSASGILKIFDFGISSTGTDYFTKDNRGTLVYAAPELFISGGQITAAADIYALGVCAWALAQASFPAELHQVPPQSVSLVPSISSALPNLPTDIAQIIDQCLLVIPTQRPSARVVSNLLAKHLVRDKHKGLLIEEQTAIYEFSSKQPTVGISVGVLGKIRIVYDGLDFELTALEGDVYINNSKVQGTKKLPEACVLTFGPPELRSARKWLTFSSSRPEVVL